MLSERDAGLLRVARPLTPSPFFLPHPLRWILTHPLTQRLRVRSLTPTPSQIEALRRFPAISRDEIAPSNLWRIGAPAAKRGRGAAAKICMTDNHANLSRIPDNSRKGIVTAMGCDIQPMPLTHQRRHSGEQGMIEGLSALSPAQLKRCRNLAGLSVGAFAREIGVARATTIREMERGDRSVSGPIARNALCLAGIWPFEQDEPPLFEYEKRLVANPDDDLSIARAIQDLERVQ